MALTKITGQVINDTTGLVVGVTTVGGGVSATDGFFSGIVTAVGDASFSGNVSVGGTLTYEDVTNIDAVGLVTARNGIVVGSGITLSKDGDIFATGVTTATTFSGSGASLTNLNASNLASGTVPSARLGSGTASSSTFLAGDSTFKTVTGTTINSNADNRLITGSGTANTLNGESGATYDGTDFTISSGRLKLTDESSGDQIRVGAGGDFTIEHDGSNSYLKNVTGDLSIQNDANIKITAKTGGTERFRVSSTGSKTTGYHQQTAPIGFCAYRLDTGTDDEYPLKNSSGNSVNTSYFGASEIQTPRGQLTTHTEYNNNGSGGSCYNHDGTKFTAPIAGVYTLTYNLSLYVVNDTGGDNSVGWGFLKNQTKLNWNTYDSGLSISQSTPYVIGANSGDTLTNAFEIGAPHLTIITTLAANDEIQVGWDNMSKILGVRSFIFSGHLLG